jgi:hypothetical protein
MSSGLRSRFEMQRMQRRIFWKSFFVRDPFPCASQKRRKTAASLHCSIDEANQICDEANGNPDIYPLASETGSATIASGSGQGANTTACMLIMRNPIPQQQAARCG